MNKPENLPDPGSDDETQDDAIIGQAFRWSVVVVVLVAIAVGVTWWMTEARKPAPVAVREAPVAKPETEAINAQAKPPVVHFTDVTQASGIGFVHVNGAEGKRFLPETMGSGAAFFDVDNDGDQDLLLINSDLWPGAQKPGVPRPTMALYANDGHGHFTDVTEASGLKLSLYGMGVAVGDYDGDGWVDVFVTAVGANHLYRNNHGRFEDVTAKAGVAGGDDRWSTSAAFFDVDGDGDLDLWVANYVRWSPTIDLGVDFQLTGIGRAYGPPTSYEGTQSYLYRNNGDGTFTDVSAQAGIQVTNPATGKPMGKALALGIWDVDGDGHPDVLVANDTVQNFLFHNLGNGRFEEVGMTSGLAFDRNGHATGAMGVDAANFRNDNALGFAIGNFANEMTSLYVSQDGPSDFTDDAILDGVGPASRLHLSFGLFFFDYDLDGRLDLLQANGHLETEINKVQPSQHYAQATQLFWNCGPTCPATFVPVPDADSGDLAEPLVGRAATYADVDGDGDLDVLITQNGRRPALFRNDQDLGHHWLRLKLQGRGLNRNAIGATVALRAGGIIQRRQVMPTRSYLSQSELPVTFGLGSAEAVEGIAIRWPDGTRQDLTNVPVDRLTVIDEPAQAQSPAEKH